MNLNSKTVFLIASIFSILSISPITDNAFAQLQDSFPNSEVNVKVEIFGFGEFDLVFSGETKVNRTETPQDTDDNGLEEIETEIVQMDLIGTHPILGDMNFTLASMPSIGKIEESVNNTKDDVEATEEEPAVSFFDLFFEININGTTLHNDDPYCVSSALATIPPFEENYLHQEPAVLIKDENGTVTGVLLGGIHLLDASILNPPEFPENLGDPCEVAVAGELLLIDSTALFLAGLQMSAVWAFPIIFVGTGVGFYLLKNRKKSN